MVFWLIIFDFRLCYRKKNIWELVWERSLLFILNDDQVHSTFLQEEPITSSFVLRDFAINHLCIRALSHVKRKIMYLCYLVRSNMSSSYRLETKREHIPVSKTTMFWIWKAYVLTILHSESKNGMLIWTQKEKGLFWIIFWPIIFELRQCYRKEKDHNIFILNDVEFHPETLKEEQKMSNFVLGFLPCNISQDVKLNLKGEW